MASDPDWRLVAVQFSWGDGTASNWSEFGPPECWVSDTHTYSHLGTFSIRARAKNDLELVSEWSDSLQVAVVANAVPPSTPSAPEGPTQTWQNESTEYRVSAKSEHGDVRFVFDWGAGELDTTERSYASNEVAVIEHVWTVHGAFTVRASAVLESEPTLASAFSRGLDVQVLPESQHADFTVTGYRTQNGTVTDFTYLPSHDLTISRFSIEFPDEPGVEYEDSRQVGNKTGGQTYMSDGWNMGGAPMPTGYHRVRFQGSCDGRAFDLTYTITVD